MLRVHFTPADLAHVRLAPGISDTWELLLSARQLQRDSSARAFGEWRGQVRASGPDPVVVAALHDCLTGASSASAAYPMPMLDGYWQRALAPYWDALRRQVTADLQERAHQQAVGGLSGLFQHICRGAEWRHPVLQVPSRAHGDVRLDGAGLVLQPSFFCTPGSVMLFRAGARRVLICPTARRARLVADVAEEELGRLIGPARVQVLDSTQLPGTTSEIAERLGMSVSGVSRHAAALAGAHLIFSAREGRCVRHSISPLGMELLGRSARHTTAPHISVA